MNDDVNFNVSVSEIISSCSEEFRRSVSTNTEIWLIYTTNNMVVWNSSPYNTKAMQGNICTYNIHLRRRLWNEGGLSGTHFALWAILTFNF